jgi:putative ABC transport system permease protein
VNPVPYVLADLRTGRATAAIVTVLIALSVAIGIGVSAQELAVRRAANAAADPFDLIVGAPGSQTQLLLSSVYLQPSAIGLVPGSVLQELAERPEVAFLSPLGFGDQYAGYPIVGVVPGFATRNGRAGLADGRVFAAIDEAVVGSRVRLDIGGEFTPVHGFLEGGIGSAHGDFAYRVVGRMEPWNSPWDSAILVPIESVWFIHGMGTGHAAVDSIFDPTGPGHDAATRELASLAIGPPWTAEVVPGVPAIAVEPATIRDAYVLRSEFRNRPTTTAIFPAEVLFALYALLGDASAILAVFSLATQLLVVMAVLVVVALTQRHKRASLAVLRALGAPRGYVLLAVWSGIAVQIVAGVLLGVGLGQALAWVLSIVASDQTGLSIVATVSAREWRRALALAAAALLLAFIPAIVAYRDQVADALRR